MKLLHTGDLHLGKSLHETSLIDDQRAMLESLEAELDRGNYAALLIAGDVYDRTIPPAEAVELFSGFLVRARREHPGLRVCLIPGNHDSARRLSFADRILGESGIHIACDPEESFKPIILDDGGKHLALFLLPFLAPGTLSGEPKPAAKGGLELDFAGAGDKILATQADLAIEAARRFGKALADPAIAGMPTALVAHCLTRAGIQSGSERVFLGTAEEVSPELFSGFSYVALGHLHRPQRVTDRMWYSGSPLAYAFDEAGQEKGFLSVDVDCSSPGFPVSVSLVPVKPLHAVTRLTGPFDEFYKGVAHGAHSSDYLEITLTDSNLVVNPVNLLRPKFPNLLSLRQGLEGAADSGDASHGEAADGAARKTPDGDKRDPVADFSDFETMLHGAVDPDRKELFAKLLAECADEA